MSARPKIGPALEAPDIADELATIYGEGFNSAAEALAAARGTEIALSNAQDRAAAYADDRAGRAIVGIDDTTESRVQGIIASGVQAGESDSEVADRLGALFGEDRADTIARTEMQTAWNMGTLGALKDAGEEYVAKYDADECGQEICDTTGDIVTIEEAEADPLCHPNGSLEFRPLTADELAEVLAEEGGE
jgi:hypothetical protein